MASEIQHNANGGSTINPVHGDLAGTDSYALSIFPDLTTKTPGKNTTPTNSTCGCGTIPHRFPKSSTSFYEADFDGANRMGTDRRPRPVCESGLALLPGYGRWHRPRPTRASSTSPRTGCVSYSCMMSQIFSDLLFQRKHRRTLRISSYTKND